MADDKLAKFEAMGGRAALEKISKVFYDKVYDHPWIGQFFAKIEQQHIEDQQVDFMQSALGGGQVYAGRPAPLAHASMNITEELFTLRQTLLKEAFAECKADETLVARWLKIDHAFKNQIVKKSLADCRKVIPSDVIMDFPKPS